MSAHYTESTSASCIILHISCPLSGTLLTRRYAHTGMGTQQHLLTKNTHTQARTPKSGHTDIYIPFNLAHHASLSGQALMMLRREKDGRSKCEMVWNAAPPNEVEVIHFRQGWKDGGKEWEEEGCKSWMQHVFKETNLHNFWHMTGRRGRGGKGEKGERWNQTRHKWEWVRLRFCKHLNISSLVVDSAGHWAPLKQQL